MQYERSQRTFRTADGRIICRDCGKAKRVRGTGTPRPEKITKEEWWRRLGRTLGMSETEVARMDTQPARRIRALSWDDFAKGERQSKTARRRRGTRTLTWADFQKKDEPEGEVQTKAAQLPRRRRPLAWADFGGTR